MVAWPDHLGAVPQRLQAVFSMRKTHRRAMAYIKGPLSTTASKSRWQLAEAQGEANPYDFQHRPGGSAWSPDMARDALPDLCDRPDGRSTGGLTEFLKKGTHSTGVGRPYWGMVGRIENCPAGIFVA